MTKRTVSLLLLLGLAVALSARADEPGKPGEGAAGEAHAEDIVTMSGAERLAAGIETARVTRRGLVEEVRAPGEVVVNAYASSRVTSRIAAQVVARHARLGEKVKRGEPLLTLSSVELARAQGELLLADRDWQRVEQLGREVVSGRRYAEAEVARQQAYARVLAFGMTEEQAKALLAPGGAALATGRFDVPSPQDGVVISDDFIVGEVVEPGRILMDVSDETTLWVEARLSPEDAARIGVGDAARVSAGGDVWFPGRVIQVHHRLEEATRTRSARLEVDNREDRLHPGQFVDVAIAAGEGAPVLAVPRDAVVLLRDRPTVFRVEGEALHPEAVATGRTRGGWTEITEGLAEGEEIAVTGAFLLKSLLLKAELGEGHVD